MYEYRGNKSNERVLKGSKATPSRFGRGYKPDNSLTNMVLDYRRTMMNKLIEDNKKKISPINILE